MDKTFQISENLLQAILSYLASKPYVEVFQMIQGIQDATKEVPKETVDTPKT